MPLDIIAELFITPVAHLLVDAATHSQNNTSISEEKLRQKPARQAANESQLYARINDWSKKDDGKRCIHIPSEFGTEYWNKRPYFNLTGAVPLVRLHNPISSLVFRQTSNERYHTAQRYIAGIKQYYLDDTKNDSQYIDDEIADHLIEHIQKTTSKEYRAINAQSTELREILFDDEKDNQQKLTVIMAYLNEKSNAHRCTYYDVIVGISHAIKDNEKVNIDITSTTALNGINNYITYTGKRSSQYHFGLGIFSKNEKLAAARHFVAQYQQAISDHVTIDATVMGSSHTGGGDITILFDALKIKEEHRPALQQGKLGQHINNICNNALRIYADERLPNKEIFSAQKAAALTSAAHG